MKVIARVVPELEQTEHSGQTGRNLLERSRGGELFLKEQSLWRQKPAEAYKESRAHSAEAWKQAPAPCGPKGLQRYFVTLTRLCSVLAPAMTRQLDQLMKVLVTELRSNPATALRRLAAYSYSKTRVPRVAS